MNIMNRDDYAHFPLGHLHDGKSLKYQRSQFNLITPLGGTRTLLSVDGKLVCDSVATYGGTPDFVSKASTAGHGHQGPTKHLSDMRLCGKELSNVQMKRGQKWRLQADYDFNKFKGMMHEDGSWDEVMGIQLAYVRIPT